MVEVFVAARINFVLPKPYEKETAGRRFRAK